MHFIPETRAVLNEIVRFGGDDISAALRHLADNIQDVVPDLVGLSLGQVKTGLVFTLAASSVEIAALDATQYVDGGPCVHASTEGTTEAWAVPTTPEDLLDEERWTLYARATAAAGIASSLSLPVVENGQIVGGVNLYASTPDAFDGHHDQIAKWLGSPVSEAVANADLGFNTRTEAQQAPERLIDLDHVNMAVGVIIHRQGVDADTAHYRLAESAARAGITVTQAAKALITTPDNDT